MRETDRLIARGRKIMGKEHPVEGELSGRDVADTPVWGYKLEDPVSA
jgi:hypothetical protein